MVSKKIKLRDCERAMDHASNYDEWRDAARTLDSLEGADEWKAQDESTDYSWQLIRERLTELRQLRKQNDVARLVFWLHEGLHGNMGAMANPRLYSQCRVGTKNLLTEYINEVCDALDYICDVESEDFPLDSKIRFFRRTGHSFGRTGLLLSGGATLGMFHIGVVKALHEEKLLPRVISGSSAGSIITSFVGTHSDDELDQVFEPDYLYLHAWKSLGFKEAFSKGAMMDGDQLEHCIAQNVGDMTFEEAFAKTGRIINITVSPVDSHQQGRLLNYLASPSVMIRSASRASCAVPGLFAPATLKAKNFQGATRPYMIKSKWADGSLSADLPMLRLARFHNVNHYIVSQTNPHVVPLMQQDKQATRGLMPFTRKLVSSSYRFYSQQLMELSRDHLELKGPLRIFEKIHNVTAQKYSGDINVYPKQGPRRLVKLLANPSPKDIESFIEEGQRRTWPEIERIRNSSQISRSFEACLQRLKDRGDYQKVAFPGTEVV